MLYGYDALNRISNIHYGNGVETAYTYDGDGNIRTLETNGSSHYKDNGLLPMHPSSVPGFVIGTANRSAVPPLFQKLSPDIISIGDIQRIIPCGDFGSNAAKSYTCLRCAVTVAVISVCKGEQDIFSRLGFQCADISVPVIGIGGFHTVTIMNAASSAQNSV